jgi:transposase
MFSIFNSQIWLYKKPIDFRKQIDGLMMMVADLLKMEPTSGQLYVFRNKQADKIKMLYWQNSGFWLLYRRLEKGRMQFPEISEETTQISQEQLGWLLSGIEIKQKVSVKAVIGTEFF